MVGFSVGVLVECFEGDNVGILVGAFEGILVGFSVGVLEECFEGDNVGGKVVGSGFGAFVGSDVTVDGGAVGVRVKYCTGTAVGPTVGPERFESA